MLFSFFFLLKAKILNKTGSPYSKCVLFAPGIISFNLNERLIEQLR